MLSESACYQVQLQFPIRIQQKDSKGHSPYSLGIPWFIYTLDYLQHVAQHTAFWSLDISSLRLGALRHKDWTWVESCSNLTIFNLCWRIYWSTVFSSCTPELGAAWSYQLLWAAPAWYPSCQNSPLELDALGGRRPWSQADERTNGYDSHGLHNDLIWYEYAFICIPTHTDIYIYIALFCKHTHIYIAFIIIIYFYTSRFVSIILAQGPCQYSLYRSNLPSLLLLLLLFFLLLYCMYIYIYVINKYN